MLIALGGTDAGDPPDSAFEALVQSAASIAKCSIDNGHQVSLVHSVGELSDARFSDCLEALAAASPDDRPLSPRLGRGLARLGRGGTVVLLACDSEQTRSDFEEAARMATARGCHTVAVVADPGSWLPHRAPPRTSVSVAGATTRTVWRNASLRTCLGA